MTVRWDDWAEKEITHLVGYLKQTQHYTLKMTSDGDLCEDCRPTLLVDLNHTKQTSSKAQGGHLIPIEGDLGSTFPQKWSSKVQHHER